MRTLRFLLEKEFRQIFRDKIMLRLMFVMPVVQLILLPLTADYEVKNVNLVIVDHDHSTYTSQFINKVAGSGYFKLTGHASTFDEGMKFVESGRADIVLEIPADFEKKLVRESEAGLFMAVDAVNGVKANLGAAYLNAIIRDFNQDIRLKWLQLPRQNPEPQIEISFSNWFNEHMNYYNFIVPGILVILVTLVGGFLTALNIVREKEIGTIEQINVTPVRKHLFILGKLIPFWILGQVVMLAGLFISWLFYDIVPAGNFGVIFIFSSVYLLAVLGMGLLISTISQSQLQAMLISFFILMIFILMGGLYTPIDSMPEWAKVITWFNPVGYFIEVMRMVVLKGSSLKDILPHVLIVAIFAVVLNSWAILSYKKRS